MKKISNKLFCCVTSFLITVFLLLDAVNINSTDVLVNRVDEPLVEYVDHYRNLYNKTCGDNLPTRYIIEFKTDPLIPEYPGVIGYCEKSAINFRIAISKRFWVYADDNQKYQLMMHELTHCFLDKDHVNDIKNYMYPSLEYLQSDIVKEQLIKDMKEYCD